MGLLNRRAKIHISFRMLLFHQKIFRNPVECASFPSLKFRWFTFKEIFRSIVESSNPCIHRTHSLNYCEYYTRSRYDLIEIHLVINVLVIASECLLVWAAPVYYYHCRRNSGSYNQFSPNSITIDWTLYRYHISITYNILCVTTQLNTIQIFPLGLFSHIYFHLIQTYFLYLIDKSNTLQCKHIYPF